MISGRDVYTKQDEDLRSTPRAYYLILEYSFLDGLISGYAVLKRVSWLKTKILTSSSSF